MTAAALLLDRARAAGVDILLDPPDTLRLRGDRDTRARLLPEVRERKAAIVALLSQAPAPDTPRRDFYRRLFNGTEARAYLALLPDQIQEALKACAVSQEVAESSVLVAVKVENAAGLMAIPRKRWDDLEALRIMHGASHEAIEEDAA